MSSDSYSLNKILLFGGSFDPPHRGHLELLKAAIAKLHPDRVHIIPSFHSPFKAAPRTAPQDRLRMAELMISCLGSSRRLALVDSFELDRGRQTFTYQVLRYFRIRYPGDELWFLVGSDSLAQFGSWKRPQELKSACGWIVGVRHGIHGASLHFPHLLRISRRLPPWSSTEIRSRLLAGLDVSRMLPSSIRAYIRRRQLYGLNIHRELKGALPKERFHHTLGVARLARELAIRHRLDPEAAATAGLLHDCGRKFNMSEMARYVRLRRLRVPRREEIARHAPVLFHAFISADLAKRHFGVQDPGVLSAIRNHTLGEVGMPDLARLVYVADIASEDRGFPAAKEIRKIARRNLKRAILTAVRTKIRHVHANGQWLHPDTKKFLAWLETT